MLIREPKLAAQPIGDTGQNELSPVRAAALRAWPDSSPLLLGVSAGSPAGGHRRPCGSGTWNRSVCGPLCWPGRHPAASTPGRIISRESQVGGGGGAVLWARGWPRPPPTRALPQRFTSKQDVIRHYNMHKKRDNSLQHGFMRFSPLDDCSVYYHGCHLNGKSTHYHCMQVPGAGPPRGRGLARGQRGGLRGAAGERRESWGHGPGRCLAGPGRGRPHGHTWCG